MPYYKPPHVDFPDEFLRFVYPLPNLARKLQSHDPVTIVTIGSSSTAGEGWIVPYPERLETSLRKRFPGRVINVLNRGVSGEEAPDELARFDRDVLAERPALVIWQVGTNAVFHRGDHDIERAAASVVTGLERLGNRDLDVVLMDLQYVPALLKPDTIEATQRMVALIAAAGGSARVNVFRRFGLMRHWHENNGIPIDEMVDPTDGDALHHSEWSMAAVAEALEQAIVGAATSEIGFGRDTYTAGGDFGGDIIGGDISGVDIPGGDIVGGDLVGNDKLESSLLRRDSGSSKEEENFSTDEAGGGEGASNLQDRQKSLQPPWVDDSAARRVSLLFATTRRVSGNPDEIFSGERESNATHYGRANVRIPDVRALGTVRVPFELKLFSISLYKQATDPRKHFVLQECEQLKKEEWLQAVKSSPTREVLVFVHGFNVKFVDGLHRCAQIAWDIRYQGIPILFSWASRGKLGLPSYIYDQASALDARERFVGLLSDLQSVGVTRVHVLAHSMGNYAVLDALANHDHRRVPLALGKVLMAAPDVDRDHYLKSVPKVLPAADGMTLYASSSDRAMEASRILAGNIPRAGDVPREGPTLVDLVDTIDATEVGTDIFGLNHGVFAEKKSILNDIRLLLSGLKSPRLVEISGMPEGEKPSKWWRYVS